MAGQNSNNRDFDSLSSPAWEDECNGAVTAAKNTTLDADDDASVAAIADDSHGWLVSDEFLLIDGDDEWEMRDDYSAESTYRVK